MKLEDDLGDTPEVHKLIQELGQICSRSWNQKNFSSKFFQLRKFFSRKLPVECFD